MKLYAESVLLGNHWNSNKLILINDKGIIESIQDGTKSEADEVAGTVIPGMVNCHSHAFQRAFAGFSEYRGNQADSFWSWRDIMYRFVAQMTPEDAHVVAKFLYLEMLKAGYTCVAEFHYLHHQVGGRLYDDPAEMSLQIVNAAESIGISITHLPVLYTYAGFGYQAPSQAQKRFIHQIDEYCQLLESLSVSLKNKPTVNLGIAPHSLRAVSQEQLTQIVPFIRKLNPKAPIHIHIAEQLQEVEDCVAYYQKRPVEWLLDHCELDANWCLIHATHLSNQETKRLAQSEAVAGICPTTEANLGDGVFPTQSFMEQGGRIALGSDSHIAVNVADEIRTLEYGQRLTTHQRAVLSSAECPSVGQNIFVHSAQSGADSVAQNVGALAVGKRADLIILDDKHPSLFAKHPRFMLDAAIFACHSMPIEGVMVAGKWVIQDGVHPEENQITNDYLQVIKRLSQ
ncbi:formimidoylglutamate deiminase [Aliikangiella marina]|uniref:Formimidoylglutamate deiminase n=1 Tax=Aliikangiella marina TaxID=1712262 RepID=A0A545TIT4_9GAMM|nr:formimidoylglutamate deiminase [Aliikangiella marina]TQV77117.1 formimidoylglutamate deiminase [Aliikangiella marina]